MKRKNKELILLFAKKTWRKTEMSKIHPTAIVDSKAEIGEGVEIGPFCIVGPNVKIGEGTILEAHSCIKGNTTLGKKNHLHSNVVLGGDPQDLAYVPGTQSYLKIGDNNVFREGFTANVGTKPGSETIIGNNNFFMANTHIAHNCKIGNRVIMANCALAAGYVEIGDCCLISGIAAIHQFCRVGRLAVLSGCSAISVDLPPFMIGHGRNGPVQGPNIVGLQRNGFSNETIRIIKDLYKIFFRGNKTVKSSIEQIKAELPMIPEVVEFIEFVETSKRGVLSAKNCNVRQY